MLQRAGATATVVGDGAAALEEYKKQGEWTGGAERMSTVVLKTSCGNAGQLQNSPVRSSQREALLLLLPA